MSHPSVSICIVTYLDSEERCQVLEATCRNALQQRYPNFEVVVSDNAGTISAEEALASISDPRLIIFRNEKNLGMAGNMNLCIERCKHDIIKMNCDDDLLHPDFLAVAVPWVDDDTYVLTDMKKFKIGSPPAELNKSILAVPTAEIREPGYGMDNDLWDFRYDGLPGCTLFTRNYYLGMSRYDTESKVGDWDMLIRSRLHRKVAFVDCILCYQGVWAGSLTETKVIKEPYFFPMVGLHTKFNVLRDPVLSLANRRSLKNLLIREFIFEWFRLLKHIDGKQYRTGFVTYAREFRRLMFRK